MTDASADRYDTQVEVLFTGTANAMRRQALPQLFELFAGRDQRSLRLVDIGCGTGRFLDAVKPAWPRLPSLGLICRRLISGMRGVTSGGGRASTFSSPKCGIHSGVSSAGRGASAARPTPPRGQCIRGGWSQSAVRQSNSATAIPPKSRMPMARNRRLTTGP